MIGTEQVSCQYLICIYTRTKDLFLHEFNMPIIYHKDITNDVFLVTRNTLVRYESHISTRSKDKAKVNLFCGQ